MSFLATLAMALLSSWLLSNWVWKNAGSLGLVHLPNDRSSHIVVTPHGGGLGFVLVVTAVGLTFFYSSMGLLLVAGLFLAGVGLWDDVKAVSAGFRFVAQALVVLITLILLNPLPSIGLITGWWVMLVFWLAGIWWINLFNFMDGIDGLASVEALSILLSVVALILIQDHQYLDSSLIRVMLVVAMSVLGFLVLNWAPARIFMGDVGSTWLAFMILSLALFTVNAGMLDYSVWLILMAVFLVDATVTLLVRLCKGQRFYQAHRSHAYQRLARRIQLRLLSKGLADSSARAAAHRRVCSFVLLVNALWLLPLAGLAVRFPQWGYWFVIFAWIPVIVTVLSFGAGKHDTA